ncbi:MAG: hypothetical protein ACXVUX_17910 [Solirubrobacteraceae bacterium]
MPVTARASAEARRSTLLAAAGFGVGALAAVAVLLVLGLQRSGPAREIVTPRSAATPPARPVTARPAVHTPPLFAPTSFWNTRLPATTPVDPNSTALVQALAAEAQRETQARIGPWIATTNSSTPLYRVGRGQPGVRVQLDAGGTSGEASLQRAFAAVPIPRDARPAPGQDRHMTVWQPSTDRLWEFWQTRHAADGWHASWGGAIRHVSQSPGYYTASAWPGSRRNWGATATSLPVIGGTMTIDELERGSIQHALAVALPAPRSATFAWPAQRTDGTGGDTALPEGARLRLDPQVDVHSLGLPRVAEMIALAAQRYGMVVRDQTHKGISLFAEDPGGQQPDPYDRLFAHQTPLELLAKFPWDRLQVLRMHLCTTAPCRAG